MTPRDRRALRLGAAIIGVALVVVVVIPKGWKWWRVERDTLAEQHALVARARAEIAAMPGLDSAAGEVHARFLAIAPRLIAGGTVAEAQASLSGLATGLADRAHVRIRRAEPKPDSLMAGRLRRITLALEVEGDWNGALGLLRAVAREPTALSVGDLELQASDPASPGDHPEVLVLQAELTGWYLPGGSR